ncbi:MAG TPA: hypothetical protein PK073_03255 [Ignavibacteriaceae bacterium]|jgi:hypothetical protein|nr:MAG: hypothetical protein BWY38_01122 [Ignavibacteria bacterium ADurb.Bin266]OQY72759.1 MAG: hypothetical protein B6D44_09155 [Ignavibacteriales bacterium UTCHB2]HQF41906.1 hypothetical protein [Ignavibacteriaceae bacterium]HQI40673.1 hypothetical protein [Ignavibacteriaceae bacterium]
MKQYEKVIEVMKQNGGFATLGFLNHKVDVSDWKTKTPFASIRRIVQDKRFFFKIKPGLWALKEFEADVLQKFELDETPKKEKDFTHSYYQGLLIEIGNLKGYKTYIPQQDKNKMFLNNNLGSISTLDKILDFSYDKIVKRAKTIDVIWFNERNLPNSFFEVEHSTDIQNSLLKFNDLQDFYSNFYILGAAERKREFEQKISYSAFKEMKNRIKFVDYDFISALHTKSFELKKLGTL